MSVDLIVIKICGKQPRSPQKSFKDTISRQIMQPRTDEATASEKPLAGLHYLPVMAHLLYEPVQKAVHENAALRGTVELGYLHILVDGDLHRDCRE